MIFDAFKQNILEDKRRKEMGHSYTNFLRDIHRLSVFSSADRSVYVYIYTYTHIYIKRVGNILLPSLSQNVVSFFFFIFKKSTYHFCTATGPPFKELIPSPYPGLEASW